MIDKQIWFLDASGHISLYKMNVMLFQSMSPHEVENINSPP